MIKIFCFLFGHGWYFVKDWEILETGKGEIKCKKCGQKGNYYKTGQIEIL